MGGCWSKTKLFSKSELEAKEGTYEVDEELRLGYGNNIEGRLNVQKEMQHVQSTRVKDNSSEDLCLLLSKVGITKQDSEAYFHTARLVKQREEIYKNICDYVQNGQEHGYGIKVLNVVRLVRQNQYEFQHMAEFKDRFRMLVWHGTRVDSINGILKDGFRLPKPKDQNFGKGIYFSDRASRSANYCFDLVNMITPTPRTKAYLLLCDVMLGNMYNAKTPHSELSKPPDGFYRTFDSVMCTGEKIPDRSFNKDFQGSIIPSGPTIQNTRFPSYLVVHNEYIVYDTDKIRIPFLVEVEFHEKPL